MPAEELHLRAAFSNKQLAVYLSTTQPWVPWSSVLSFYSALHLVDAYFATKNYHPRSHEDRAAAIRLTSDLRAIYGDYRTLETRSRESRYDLRPMTTPQATALLERVLPVVEHCIEELLSHSLGPV